MGGSVGSGGGRARGGPALVACLVGLVVATPARARADEDPRQASRKLVEEANDLGAKGKWSEACPKYAEATKLEPSLPTTLRLADCYERAGKTASAWQSFSEAASVAAAAGDVKSERLAKDRAERLAARVDRVIIVPPSIPDVEIERDGKALPKEELGKPVPLDPGEHTVHAWAPGKSSYDVLLKLTGKGDMIRVEIPVLEPALPFRLASEREPTVTTSPGGNPFVEEPPPPVKPLRSLRPWGVGFGIAGLAALGAGAALYANTEDRHPTATCAEGRCTGSVALISGGAVALVLGAILFTTSYIEP